MKQINLGEVIDELKKHDPAQVVANGFGSPHSYRGYYHELAFSPAENVTIGSMLEHAKSALNQTFTGYKGGDFTMCESTPCSIAEYGDCGSDDEDDLTHARLLAMLGVCCPTCGCDLAGLSASAPDLYDALREMTAACLNVQGVRFDLGLIQRASDALRKAEVGE